MWLQGPDFIWEYEVPRTCVMGFTLSSYVPEMKKTQTVCHTVKSAESKDNLLQRIGYFSDWFKAQKAVALCMCLRVCLRRKLVTDNHLQ